MSTTRRAWQKFEQRVARFFGSERNPLSGSGAGLTASDTKHPALFIEAKLRVKSPVHRLFAKTEQEAKKEHKTPLLALQEKNHAGWLLVCRPEDIHTLSSYAKDYDSLPGNQEEGISECVRFFFWRDAIALCIVTYEPYKKGD